MNFKQYIKLCKINDKILLTGNARKSRIAIPWLHIIREHSVFLKKYNHIFSGSQRLKLSTFKIYKSIRNKFGIIQILYKSIFSKEYTLFKKNLKKKNKNDILFISHLLNEKQFSNKNDFYFHDLVQKNKKYGLKSSILLLNHTSASSLKIKKEHKHKILMPKLLKFTLEIKHVFIMLIEYLHIIKQRNKRKDSLTKKIIDYAAIEALSRSSLNGLRLGYCVEELVKKIKPSILITTFEGHAWERLAFYSAKKVDPHIKCVGYTHAPLFKNQHSIRRPLEKFYNPDLILTSGTIQKSQLKEYAKKIPIEILGSPRYIKTSNKKFKTKKNRILVAPEGILSEIGLLFNFSLKCSLKFPNLDFIWRLHPLFKFDILRKININEKNIPSNVEYSNLSFVEDLDRCNYILYRGSSAVIQAVMSGLIPLYFHRENEMPIDPLYGLKVLKISVNTIEELRNVIDNQQIDDVEHKKAMKYCSSFFNQLNYKLLPNMLHRI